MEYVVGAVVVAAALAFFGFIGYKFWKVKGDDATDFVNDKVDDAKDFVNRNR